MIKIIFDYEDLYHVQCMYHWCLAPSIDISRIWLHTNSNVKLLHIQEEKYFGNLFLGWKYFAQRFNRPLYENGQKKLAKFWVYCGFFG